MPGKNRLSNSDFIDFQCRQRSQSTKNIYEQLQNSLQGEAKVLLKAKVEDPDVLQARRTAAQSKSVTELSQISGFGDFPVPDPLKRLISRSKGDLRSSSSKSGSKK